MNKSSNKLTLEQPEPDVFDEIVNGCHVNRGVEKSEDKFKNKDELIEDHDIKSFNGSPKKTYSRFNDAGRHKNSDLDKVCKNPFLSRSLEKSGDILKHQDDKVEDQNKENLGMSVNSFYGNSDKTFYPRRQASTPIKVPHRRIRLGGLHSGVSNDKVFADKSNGYTIYDDIEDDQVIVGRISSPKIKSRQRSPLASSLWKVQNTSPHLIGFPNAGLTCYLNAVLQALLGTKCFDNDLITACSKESSMEASEGLVQSFSQLSRFKNEGNQTETNRAISKLRKNLSKDLPQFVSIQMQDAHEFLVFFCDHLANQFVKLGQESNPFSDNFHFQLEEQRVCCQCSHSAEKIKGEFVLRIDMPCSSSQDDSEDLLSTQTLLKKTLLGSGIEVTCPNCTRSLHESKDTYKSIPRVMILYLPRSQYFNNQQRFCKNRIQIDIDVVIDLKEHVLENNVDKSKVSMPATVLETEKSRRKRRSSGSENLERFDKMKKLSEGGVISDVDLENPSEEDQLKWALEQSLNTNSDSKNDFNATSDQIKCDGDVSKLSEEDQLKLALDLSLNESCKREEEEEKSLMQALQASLQTDEVQSKENDSLTKERQLEITGKTEATEEFEYQLTAVISHVNSKFSVETGHYIADVFNCEKRQWFHYNDMKVSRRSLQSVIQQSSLDGCLFFYTHKNLVKYDY